MRDKFMQTPRDYWSPAETKGWSAFGSQLFRHVRSGFAKWADYKQLKVQSPENITDYYTITPFKSKQ